MSFLKKVQALAKKYIAGTRYAPIKIDTEQAEAGADRAMLMRLNRAFSAAYDGQAYKAEEHIKGFLDGFKHYAEKIKVDRRKENKQKW